MNRLHTDMNLAPSVPTKPEYPQVRFSPLVKLGSPSTLVDWEAVHREIQGILSELAKRVQQRRPQIRASVEGFTNNYVFSTCLSFDVPSDHAIDAVVASVGANLLSSGKGVELTGDLCRDGSGHIIYDASRIEASFSITEIIEAARSLANELSAQIDLISDALTQPGHPSV